MNASGEIKFWRWQCVACSKETVHEISGRMPPPCETYWCGGTHFLKVGEGRTREEAERKS
ncbi:MAG: hypothetical protein WBQ86_09720 [Candidatus Binatus sp.]